MREALATFHYKDREKYKKETPLAAGNVVYNQFSRIRGLLFSRNVRVGVITVNKQ